MDGVPWSRFLSLLATGVPGGSGTDEDAAQLCGLLIDGLWAVASEQPQGWFVSQFRGGDVERGREFEASFLYRFIYEVGGSGLLARDMGVEKPQREQLANFRDGRDRCGQKRIASNEIGLALHVDALPG